MKKNYIKPQVMIVEIKQTQMIAASQPEVQQYLYNEETEYQW